MSTEGGVVGVDGAHPPPIAPASCIRPSSAIRARLPRVYAAVCSSSSQVDVELSASVRPAVLLAAPDGIKDSEVEGRRAATGQRGKKTR